jgi:8-oxo-dGTP pyrophosphatase MutT (NUDIX family)
MDAGEDLKSALAREIKEETGLDIDQNEFILIDDLGHGESEKTLKTGEKVLCQMHFNVFKTTLPHFAEEIRIDSNEEFERVIWADYTKLNIIKLTPPSIILFERLGML